MKNKIIKKKRNKKRKKKRKKEKKKKERKCTIGRLKIKKKSFFLSAISYFSDLTWAVGRRFFCFASVLQFTFGLLPVAFFLKITYI